MFDTHCHLNFKAFDGRVAGVIADAKKEGINLIVIPGTDIISSQKAVEIAGQYSGVYAAVGIHPHHVYEKFKDQVSSPVGERNLKSEMSEIEKLLENPKVVAIGEVGMDRHYYNKTKYPDYKIDEAFISQQEDFLRAQIDLAIKYKKSIIFHNREAKADFLKVLSDYLPLINNYRCVFHCCEPDGELLDFAVKNNIFIGVDGDVTFWQEKQEFIKKVPPKKLVLETDSPFLLPVQLREGNKKRPANEPKNISLIADFLADLIGIKKSELGERTVNNSKRLFRLS